MEYHRKSQASQHRIIQNIGFGSRSSMDKKTEKKQPQQQQHGFANVWLTFWCYDYYGWRWTYHTDVVASIILMPKHTQHIHIVQRHRMNAASFVVVCFQSARMLLLLKRTQQNDKRTTPKRWRWIDGRAPKYKRKNSRLYLLTVMLNTHQFWKRPFFVQSHTCSRRR